MTDDTYLESWPVPSVTCQSWSTGRIRNISCVGSRSDHDHLCPSVLWWHVTTLPSAHHLILSSLSSGVGSREASKNILSDGACQKLWLSFCHHLTSNALSPSTISVRRMIAFFGQFQLRWRLPFLANAWGCKGFQGFCFPVSAENVCVYIRGSKSWWSLVRVGHNTVNLHLMQVLKPRWNTHHLSVLVDGITPVNLFFAQQKSTDVK